MLPILSTSALILLGLLPLQEKRAADAIDPGPLASLVQDDAARSALPQSPVPSNLPGGTAKKAANVNSKSGSERDGSVEFVAPGYYGIYSNQKCREIYAACDLDGDDKIQYLEALKTLDSVSSPKDFRRLDKNNDGILRFKEFDLHFQRVCEAGSNLVVKPKAMSRIHLKSESKKTKDHGLLRWFATIDRDGNDKIDSKEWAPVSSVLGEGLGTSFLKLDADFSGSLTAGELAPLKPLFDKLETIRPTSNHLRPLPEATRSVDLNDDGLLGMQEFTRAIARIHPNLVQHADIIFKNADQNDDKRLDAIEITRALTLGTAARGERKLRLR